MRIRGAVLEAKGGPFVVEAGVVERSRSAVTSLAPADHVKGRSLHWSAWAMPMRLVWRSRRSVSEESEASSRSRSRRRGELLDLVKPVIVIGSV